jgi:cyclase
MPRKRVIYTLFYDSGFFMLSRNFRLQRAGDLRWLLKNYGFGDMAAYIDELMIVDVSRQGVDRRKFIDNVREIIKGCFVPVTLGGGIDSLDDARFLIANGADKVVLNRIFDHDPDVVRSIADTFGEQCVVGGVDLKRNPDGGFVVFSDQGAAPLATSPRQRVQAMLTAGAGEILLQSIDRDGTGQGFDFDMLTAVGGPLPVPLILCGGCGRSEHMGAALARSDVDAIATANLFNFIGDGLQTARLDLLATGMDLAAWDVARIRSLHDVLRPAA